jgi:hypothetical protein
MFHTNKITTDDNSCVEEMWKYHGKFSINP